MDPKNVRRPIGIATIILPHLEIPRNGDVRPFRSVGSVGLLRCWSQRLTLPASSLLVQSQSEWAASQGNKASIDAGQPSHDTSRGKGACEGCCRLRRHPHGPGHAAAVISSAHPADRAHFRFRGRVQPAPGARRPDASGDLAESFLPCKGTAGVDADFALNCDASQLAWAALGRAAAAEAQQCWGRSGWRGCHRMPPCQSAAVAFLNRQFGADAGVNGGLFRR